jgi:hypothetical protein
MIESAMCVSSVHAHGPGGRRTGGRSSHHVLDGLSVGDAFGDRVTVRPGTAKNDTTILEPTVPIQ